MTIRIACLQLDIAFGDPQKNEQQAEKAVELAVKEGADIIVLPELWTTGYDLTRLGEIADDNAERAKTFASRLAQTYGIHFVAGSVAKKTDAGVTNTMIVANRNGQIIKEYSKVHLFQLMDEHLHLQSGNEPGLFSLDELSCAGVICYDIRFPEWIRTHALSGAELLFVVAEWPLPRLHHWRTLLMARAIENQCYVVACNRAGSDPNNVFAGHSLIIDPWGEILAEADEDPGILLADIDPALVRDVRSRIPVFADRRPRLYEETTKKFFKTY
ncbi:MULTISPECIES: carbon-nitrogen family hydrolase [Geobacillus]|jgi:omega-amidase|uniref:carbon-nitrogen family hydrolase n=1 Tax=Geobacillus TaxID=129337 RepID=UPI00017E3A20|nr:MULTISPECIES: carbon-nitrogen family hydrolase [Geobacillus]ARP41946.1 Hydrolase in agr operon [Geobacillus thermodenitrificans]ATO36694.1 carbon-nitrogen hydrolase [Geobacillus thermodenitrificans]KQB94162.1 Hydrolase MtnU [Geobacillus sp. PA-3]MED3716562.1 carbon-nitrogen family hydrolase [Geobacillus thermodenitrificans]MED4918469.1 carbon-nitrogen family hydrolase [Geobacillus thermodenitrificans]